MLKKHLATFFRYYADKARKVSVRLSTISLVSLLKPKCCLPLRN